MKLTTQQRTKIYRKLRKAWAAGMPDRKAAQYAGIPADELKDLIRLDAKLALMRSGVMSKALEVEIAARTNVNRSIKEEGNVDSSKWLLERKVPEEFSTKSQVAVQADDFATIDDKKAQLEKMMEKFGSES